VLDFSPSELPDYLKSVRDIPFKWGEHDCLIFTNNAWKVMYGHGWADDWLDRYMDGVRPLSRKELHEEYGYKSFVAAVDSRLARVSHVPPRGALVTTRKARRWAIGNALGISVGIKAAFLGPEGVIYHPIDTIDKAWVEA
jgi:hypothetical protein